MYDKIEIFPYNPDWQNWFTQIKSLLTTSLGNLAISIDHIGSTSVPGLGSKNRIDVQITVDEISQRNKEFIDSALKKSGFSETEFGIDHRPPNDTSSDAHWNKIFFSGKNPHLPFDFNVHIRAKGAKNQEYALLFRDFLCAHPDIAAAYQRLKEELTFYHSDNINAYVDIKDPACDIIISAARGWKRL